MRVEPKMGLRIWNELLDLYDHEQLADNFAKIGAHDHSPGRGVLIPSAGIAPEAIIGSLLAEGAIAEKKGALYLEGKESERPSAKTKGRIYYATDTHIIFFDTGVEWLETSAHGHKFIAAEQSRESATFATLATPDEVTITLPENGLISVYYKAIWASSVAEKAQAIIQFNGVNAQGTSVNGQETTNAGTLEANKYYALTTSSLGGMITPSGEGINFNKEVGTGQQVQGPATYFANAGVYKVAITFATISGSGNVKVKERKLWVEAKPF